jgi:hypothetical protein
MQGYMGFALDAVLLAALAAVAYRGWKLSRQFEKMQADRAAFEKLIAALNLAASRAEGAVMTMREAASASAEALQSRTNTARALCEELEIIVQAGDNLAERLQKLAENSGRQATAAALLAADAQLTADTPPAPQPRTKAEKELLEAVKAKQKS